jgi:lysophospholipase L1-like esterase
LTLRVFRSGGLFLTVAALLTCLLAAGPAPSGHLPLAATPIARLDLPWWKARHEAALHRLHQQPVDLLFLGDSITQNFERTGPSEGMNIQPVWQHFYTDRNAVNLGFKGDTTASLLWRIRNGEVAGITPKAAIILIGANNLGHVHWSAADTVTGIETIVADLRQRLPATKLLLIGVLPSERSPWVDETTIAINAALAERYAKSTDVTWFDPTPLFTKDGKTDRTLYYDPTLSPPEPTLHPDRRGMERLAIAIEPIVASMLGDRNKLLRR